MGDEVARPRRYTASLVNPPDRNTRIVIVNASTRPTPFATSCSWTSVNDPAVSHLVNRDDARGELAQPSRRETTDEILGEHRQAFLGLVVVGETSAEEAQRLVATVDVGDDVRADLVLQQRVARAATGTVTVGAISRSPFDTMTPLLSSRTSTCESRSGRVAR